MREKMNKNGILAIMTCVIGLAMAPAGAMAATTPQAVSTHDSWTVYTFNEDNGTKVCFMSAEPAKAEGNYTRRGSIFAMITHWSGADGARNVFSYRTGYSYKTGSDVTVTIDGRTFTLFTDTDNKEMAWTSDQKTDDALADAIMKGSKMVVKGTSSRGTLTTDTFDLKGTADAYRKISALCNVSL